MKEKQSNSLTSEAELSKEYSRDLSNCRITEVIASLNPSMLQSFLREIGVFPLHVLIFYLRMALSIYKMTLDIVVHQSLATIVRRLYYQIILINEKTESQRQIQGHLAKKLRTQNLIPIPSTAAFHQNVNNVNQQSHVMLMKTKETSQVVCACTVKLLQDC